MRICRLGRVAYDEALDLQLQLVELRQQDLIQDTILLLEHPPVITLGTRGKMEHIYREPRQLAADGVTIHKVGRGGDVTYHGPGQLVVYPIVKLYNRPGGIREFIETLEQAVISWLAEQYGLKPYTGHGKLTGIWIDDAKIMAVGLAVKQGVTMHGLALNLLTDLTPFSWINPCGLMKPVTSLHLLTQRQVDFRQAQDELAIRFADGLGEVFEWIERADLVDQAAALRRQLLSQKAHPAGSDQRGE